jgi:hypothetical protein
MSAKVELSVSLIIEADSKAEAMRIATATPTREWDTYRVGSPMTIRMLAEVPKEPS